MGKQKYEEEKMNRTEDPVDFFTHPEISCGFGYNHSKRIQPDCKKTPDLL